VLVRRDDPNPGRPEKRSVAWSSVADDLRETLDAIQANLFARASAQREVMTHTVETFDELRAIIEGPRGFIRAHWCGDPVCEAKIKADTGATIRCLPLSEPAEAGHCIVDGRPSTARVLFARAY
jgi:prolyl-tRNA synthetase